MNPEFRKAYAKVLEGYGAYSGAYRADEYVNQVDEAVAEAQQWMQQVAKPNKGLHFLKGDMGEAWHASTLRANAARNGDQSVRVFFPRDGSPVDVQMADSNGTHTGQVKYNGTATDTAKAISEPKYGQVEQKVVPSDQLKGVHEEARRQALRNVDSRPDQAAQYQHTADRASDRLRAGESESTPLTEREADSMAREVKHGRFDPREHGLSLEEVIRFRDLLRESGEAALNAAAITAAMQAAPHLWQLTKAALDGSFDPRMLLEGGAEVGVSSSVAGLRGGIAACLTGACRAGLLGSGLKSVSPAVVGAGTAVALNALGYAWKVSQGEMDLPHMAEACLRDAAIVSAGLFGAGLGQAQIPVPVLGALIGNLVGSTVAAVTYQGGRSILIGLCVEKGWTLFGLVKQDHTLPDEVLDSLGYRRVLARFAEARTVSFRAVDPRVVAPVQLTITPLQRGLIRIDTVAYV